MHPLAEYPRPALRRDSCEILNGPWQYAITQTAEYPAAWQGTIRVPYSPEAPASGVNRTPAVGAVAALPPPVRPAGGGGRPGAAALRGRGLCLRRAGQWASGGRPPGRLLALHTGHYRPAQRHRPQQPVGGRAGPHRPRHPGPGQTDVETRRDVLPGPERHLADRLAGAGAGQLYPDPDRHAGLRRPHGDGAGAHGKARRCGQPVGHGAGRGRDHRRGLGQRRGRPGRRSDPEHPGRAFLPMEPGHALPLRPDGGHQPGEEAGFDTVHSYFALRKWSCAPDAHGCCASA